MKSITLFVLGMLITILGISNIKGNIASIHWYNRTKVSEKDAPKYGKAMGTGTIIAGLSIVITAILRIFFCSEQLFYIAFVGIVIGVAIMLYAQFKYNRGIF
ncbi:MAG: hypothetical protein ACOX7K_03465 [Oscillospiraceae bacterium]|jgi:hypothetical protein